MRLLMFTLWFSFAAPIVTAQTTTAPATLPGSQIDLRTATAVADFAGVVKVDAIEPMDMHWESAIRYARVTLITQQPLKDKSDHQFVAFAGVPDPGAVEFRRQMPIEDMPRVGGTYVVFSTRANAVQGKPHAFKFALATDDVVAEVQHRLRGVVTTRPAPTVAAEIILPPKLPADATRIEVALRLTNGGKEAIRICTFGQNWRGSGKGFAEARFTPGMFISDTPAMTEFARHVRTISPGKSFDLPIDFFLPERSGPVRLDASYDVSPDVATALDIDPIGVTAPPVTIQHASPTTNPRSSK